MRPKTRERQRRLTLLAQSTLPELVLLEDIEDLYQWRRWRGEAYGWIWAEDVQAEISSARNEGFAETFF